MEKKRIPALLGGHLLALLSVTLPSAFADDSTTVSLTGIYDLIQQERGKSSVNPSFEKRLEGTWYETYRQPQVYPAGCSMDSRGRMTPDLRKIKLSIDEPLEVYADLQRVAGKLRWNRSQAVRYEGNTLVSGQDGETRCVVSYQPATGADALICFENFYDHGNCGWYSFFVQAN